ncbi:hypothetical protein PAPYR_10396 [Paratrimastix pyriformis]|uniref:Uncharacterized protein n=1 Tax=Paratrimastix pyriformis TaxID=342808 RepID=A0ABQ8U8M6_9EUKA|nr:hypothetical protein PAPYR_10396 [Paratrimastix pyriformis]
MSRDAAKKTSGFGLSISGGDQCMAALTWDDGYTVSPPPGYGSMGQCKLQCGSRCYGRSATGSSGLMFWENDYTYKIIYQGSDDWDDSRGDCRFHYSCQWNTPTPAVTFTGWEGGNHFTDVWVGYYQMCDIWNTGAGTAVPGPNYCVIDGTCYDNGYSWGDCYYCDSGRNQYGWSLRGVCRQADACTCDVAEWCGWGNIWCPGNAGTEPVITLSGVNVSPGDMYHAVMSCNLVCIMLLCHAIWYVSCCYVMQSDMYHAVMSCNLICIMLLCHAI